MSFTCRLSLYILYPHTLLGIPCALDAGSLIFSLPTHQRFWCGGQGAGVYNLFLSGFVWHIPNRAPYSNFFSSCSTAALVIIKSSYNRRSNVLIPLIFNNLKSLRFLTANSRFGLEPSITMSPLFELIFFKITARPLVFGSLSFISSKTLNLPSFSSRAKTDLIAPSLTFLGNLYE